MKLRITQESVRFRLKQAEVKSLQQGATLWERCPIGSGSLAFSVVSGNGFQAELAGNELALTLPHADVQKWANSDSVSLTYREPLTTYLVEKDFRCLTSPNEKDNEDTFPNPNENC